MSVSFAHRVSWEDVLSALKIVSLRPPMIVVDSNILAYLYLPCEYTGAAETLMEQHPDWAAPILWRSEFRNILAGYLRRKAFLLSRQTAYKRKAKEGTY